MTIQQYNNFKNYIISIPDNSFFIKEQCSKKYFNSDLLIFIKNEKSFKYKTMIYCQYYFDKYHMSPNYQEAVFVSDIKKVIPFTSIDSSIKDFLFSSLDNEIRQLGLDLLKNIIDEWSEHKFI